MEKNILLVLLSIVVLSCNSDDDNSRFETVDSTLISKGALYGNGAEGISKQNLVISDQYIWNELITKMNSVNNVSEKFSEIDIDFSKYMVIAVFDDIKVNGGHDLELDIRSNSEAIVVNITDLMPEGNLTAVITQPYHIVKIIKSELPIVFE